MKQVELLAPAGNMDCFYAAIHAGADAVYLGGNKYGARAFADNFSEEELCGAIRYAHIWGKKVYLTLNILMKEEELSDVKEYVLPYYLAGLDGVIVQDLGLFLMLQEWFPGLELHGSTQMTITSPEGARFLQNLGATRVVPARELSLQEMKAIKETGIEVECFIHGAMCYSYSGQCLCSSFLGGRSGNRGKCAGSCRLPYSINNKKNKCYPLSLKDMCTIELIPKILDAGIDSLKIEGRMKSPEYVAGVVSIYRKYIDKYYNDEDTKVSQADLEKLSGLYLRSQRLDGYYTRHNGKEMITLEKPSYNGCSESYLKELQQQFLENRPKQKVNAIVNAKIEEPLQITYVYKQWEGTAVGNPVQAAKSRPMGEADIVKQIGKLGATSFQLEQCNCVIEGDIFIPNQELNQLRREALEKLEVQIRGNTESERQACIITKYQSDKNSCITEDQKHSESNQSTIAEQKVLRNISISTEEKLFRVSVFSLEQLQWCLENASNYKLNRIYIDSHLFLEEKNFAYLVTYLQDLVTRDCQLFIILPYIFRKKDSTKVDKLCQVANQYALGVLINDWDTYAYLQEKGFNGEVAFNYSIYTWNQKSLDFWKEKAGSICSSLECNYHQLKQLQAENMEYVIYGRIPMMISTNCIKKTSDSCRNGNATIEDFYKDRYQKKLPVQVDCHFCYNRIFNSVPLSYHGSYEKLQVLSGNAYRLDFTDETTDCMQEILDYYQQARMGKKDITFPLADFTTGHLKKGAL